MRVYSSKDSSIIPVKWLLEAAFPHVVKSFAAFTYSSMLYILQQAGGQSLDEYMSFGTKFSSKTLLRQLSGVAAKIQELSESRAMTYRHTSTRHFPFGLTPERLFVFPDGPTTLRLSIDISYHTEALHWYANYGHYNAPEALNEYRVLNWRAEITWCIGCTYLEILIWHVMGYDGLCDFRDRLSQSNWRPYFFSPEEPGTDRGIREHEAVVTIFQALHSQTDGHVREAVDLVQRMLAINPNERPIASDVASEFRQITTTPEERADTEANEQEKQEGHQPLISRPEDAKNESRTSSPDTAWAYALEPDLNPENLPYDARGEGFGLGIPVWRPTPRETEDDNGEVGNEDKE